jgi:hypothetical protein
VHDIDKILQVQIITKNQAKPQVHQEIVVVARIQETTALAQEHAVACAFEYTFLADDAVMGAWWRVQFADMTVAPVTEQSAGQTVANGVYARIGAYHEIHVHQDVEQYVEADRQRYRNVHHLCRVASVFTVEPVKRINFVNTYQRDQEDG